MFLHYIVTLNKEELVAKVFRAQYEDPIKNDWWLQVKNDLKEFQLDHLTIDEIQKIKKDKFKEIVKKACNVSAFEYLLKENSSKSKVKHIKYSALELQPYLKSNNIFDTTKKIFYFQTKN